MPDEMLVIKWLFLDNSFVTITMMTDKVTLIVRTVEPRFSKAIRSKTMVENRLVGELTQYFLWEETESRLMLK